MTAAVVEVTREDDPWSVLAKGLAVARQVDASAAEDMRARGDALPDLLAESYAKVRAKITRQSWDYLSAITGPEGTGKSSLALTVARLTDPDFSEANVAFSGVELLQKANEARAGSTLVFDEAVNGAWAMDYSEKTNKALVDAAMIIRELHLHLVFCIPRFWDLSPYFRDHRVRAWLQVRHRGEVVVHVPVRSYYGKEVFWKPAFRHHYGKPPADLWRAYRRLKRAYVKSHIKEALREMGHATDEDAEAVESPADRHRRIALEVSKDASFWNERGTISRGKVAAKYGLSASATKHVASMASAMRPGRRRRASSKG
jgi:hypothetical protein